MSLNRLVWSDAIDIPDFHAVAAAPVARADAQVDFAKLTGATAGLARHARWWLLDLVAAGVGASTTVIQPWVWSEHLGAWMKPNAWKVNGGNAITGNNGFNASELLSEIFLSGYGALFLQPTGLANITALTATLRFNVSP